MNKILSLLGAFLFCFANGRGQTTAPDFTAVDCNSVSHTLYTELDAGKIIVLVWVEPCGGCISDSKDAYDAALSFASTNPGQVLLWLSDDLGNTDCATLGSWATSNGILPMNITLFGNAGNTIDEAGFGGTGMPHVVVLGGGTSHHIFYNKLSGSGDKLDIEGGIVQALHPSSLAGAVKDASFTIFPNPARDQVSAEFILGSAGDVAIEMVNSLGAEVLSSVYHGLPAGRNLISFKIAGELPAGSYFLRLASGIQSQVLPYSVIR